MDGMRLPRKPEILIRFMSINIQGTLDWYPKFYSPFILLL